VVFELTNGTVFGLGRRHWWGEQVNTPTLICLSYFCSNYFTGIVVLAVSFLASSLLSFPLCKSGQLVQQCLVSSPCSHGSKTSFTVYSRRNDWTGGGEIQIGLTDGAQQITGGKK